MDDLESLEAISQSAEARSLFLRMAAFAQHGRTGRFLAEIEADADLDAATKARLTELAEDHSFLLAVEEYLVRTHRVH